MSTARKVIPIAPHAVEPYDGTDAMVRCEDCRSAGVPGWNGRGGCPWYVPSMRATWQHCAAFKGRAH